MFEIFIFSTGLLILNSFVHQSLRLMERQKYRPQGDLINVGGFHLHVQLFGEEKSPTIIFGHGFNTPSLPYNKIAQELAQDFKVCIYDRAGYGWSHTAHSPRTVQNEALELKKLIDSLGLRPPIILVAHSLSTLYFRYFAAQYPHLVKGLILLDPVNEKYYFEGPREEARILEKTYRRVLRLTKLNREMARFGFNRLVSFLTARVAFRDLPPSERAKIRVANNISIHFRATHEDARMLKQNLSAVHKVHLPENLPVTVAYSPRIWNKEGMQRLVLGLSKAEFSKLIETKTKMDADMATLTTQTQLVEIPNSSHSIPSDRPDLVVDLVRDMAEKICPREQTTNQTENQAETASSSELVLVIS